MSFYVMPGNVSDKNIGVVDKITKQIEHTRNRSVLNFFVNIVSAMVAYNFKPSKPSIYHELYLIK